MGGRVVLHVDLDYYYAQCEERRHPELKGKPIVVCVYSGRTADSGAVSTANYAARRYGVKSGIPIVFAKRLLKDVDAAFLPVDDLHYEAVSSRVMAILRAAADPFEQASIDEAYLDVTRRTEGHYDRASELARELKSRIREAERLTCSVGVGPNKVVAKIASDLQKPDGLTVVKPEDIPQLFGRLEVGKLPGVGKKTEKALEELGVKTIGDLARISAERLVSVFGRKLGRYFHDAANGLDDEPVEEKDREQFSRILTLKENTRDLTAITEGLEAACEDLYRTVVSQGFSFRTVGVIAIMEDLSLHTRSETLEQGLGLKNLKASSRELLEGLLEDYPDLQVRRIGVKASGLARIQGQKTLSDFLKV